MIKLCKILSFNKNTNIVVAEYDNEQIQFVTNKNISSITAYIKKTSSGYEVIDKSEYDKYLKSHKKSIKNDVKLDVQYVNTDNFNSKEINERR